MANKRLSLGDIQAMKDMVQKGIAPEDIAKHFGIAISSVHNYKNRFKAEGVNFPSVRGKRPTGSVQSTSQVSAENIVMSKNDGYNFTINGVLVHVSGQAKSVNINKNGIEINF